MGEFLKKKIGQERYDSVLTYLSGKENPLQSLKQPLTPRIKELLLGDIADPKEEAK